MDKFFALFGKLTLILLLLGAVAFGAYQFGRGRYQLPETTQQTLSVTPTPLPPSPTATPKEIVSAGLGNLAGVNFPKYTIEVPADWVVTKEHSEKDSPMDVLTITKGVYRLKIFQAATGGSICLYPSDPPSEGPSASFTTFVELNDSQGRLYRRSGSSALTRAGTVGFTLCHKSDYGNFQQPTPFGHVSFTLPEGFTDVILAEMDAMIASLKKL